MLIGSTMPFVYVAFEVNNCHADASVRWIFCRGYAAYFEQEDNEIDDDEGCMNKFESVCITKF